MNLNSILIISLTLLSMLSLSQSVLCPDRRSKCKEGMTCCKWSTGAYGCCPLTSAQCCADGMHCCPNGTQCDNKEGTCDGVRNNFKPIALKTPLNETKELCPECLPSQTCCREKGGGYGCCPYELGVCCKDMLHCCPHNTKCDVIHKQCVRPANGLVHKNMRLIRLEAKNITDIVCPGGRYDCPDGNTCCPLTDTLWGCCPMDDAVCCEDRTHCCPNGSKCTEKGCQSL